jgi:hypothetical protein
MEESSIITTEKSSSSMEEAGGAHETNTGAITEPVTAQEKEKEKERENQANSSVQRRQLIRITFQKKRGEEGQESDAEVSDAQPETTTTTADTAAQQPEELEQAAPEYEELFSF